MVGEHLRGRRCLWAKLCRQHALEYNLYGYFSVIVQPHLLGVPPLLMSKLRLAACNADRVTLAWNGGDPTELIALAMEIGEREGCSVEYVPLAETPGFLTLHFKRRDESRTRRPPTRV
jgi:hypothetical protein